MAIKDLLELTVQRGASDLHIIAGLPPYLRVQGNLLAVKSEAIMTQDIIEKYLKEILNPENLERFGVNRELDFSLSFSAKSRFRVNAYTQRGSFAISFRNIPIEIPPIDELGLPKILHAFTTLRQGFVLVTGPTGHGKSTTITSILNKINETRSCHIITIEGPIEFLFKPRNSIVSQREMGGDTHSWQIALRSVLREDPDVVLVGEMRDYETISAALTVAETGHLVFATLHTNSAAQTIDRIIDAFPEHQQNQARQQLASTLSAVVCQRLVPALNGGRIPAVEILL